MSYFGNNESVALFLFDSKTSKLIRVEGVERFGSSRVLKSNTNYFYSYNRAGCADYNWESDLFKILDYKVVALGYIYGQGCDYETESNPQEIKIYKVDDDQNQGKKLFLVYPYDQYVNEKINKWDFIGEYWNSNYRLFDF